MTDDPQHHYPFAAMDKKNFAALVPNKTNLDGASSANNNNCSKTPISNKQDGVAFLNARGKRRGGGGGCDPSSLPKSNSANALSSRCDPPNRRNSPQKSKGLDKKPRGSGFGGSMIDKRNGPEVGSLQSPGAKKRDWDHLFYFAPRERRTSPNCVWKSHHAQRGRNDSGGASLKNKFSKENFLRANCQFLVKSDKDYAPYFADPDLLVDWNDVEQIVVTMIGEGASCPICLGTPIAAKMTRCGHIYCWSCILHYLALSDNASRPCPICYEAIANNDLKSVVAHVHFDIELGDIIDMELLRRHKDMLAVAPLHSHEATEAWNELYAKLVVISSSDVMEKVVDRELRELTACYEEDPDCPEVCFIHQAIGELSERKKVLMVTNNVTIDKNPDSAVPNEGTVEHPGDVGDTTVSPEHCDSEKDEYFHFYQDSKGLNVFLHPLNFSMLAKQFGTEMEFWPRYLSLRVIDKEYYSASEESRKRWKFLRHLPLSTPFTVVEVDLSEFVSEEVMTEFASQIDYRKTRRTQRAKEEKKMEKIIAERERKLWKIPVVPHFEPKLDFPEFLDSATGGLELSAERLETFDMVESPPFEGIHTTTPTSFAMMASRAPVQMKRSPSFPLVKSSALPTSHYGSIPPRRHSDDDEPESDHVAVPEFRESITKALMKIVFEEKDAKSGNGNGQQQKNKKKKNKGKVLFTTGMGSFN